MKADPINILLNKNFKFDKKFYLIIGNEITLIEGIKQIIINHYSNLGSFNSNLIKNIRMADKEIGLFGGNKLYLVGDLAGVDKDGLDSLSNELDVFVFSSETSPKTRLLKSIFLKRGDSCLVECYELTKEQKVSILADWLNKTKITLDKSGYWNLLERTDSRYGLFKQELDKISELSGSKIDNDLIEKIITKESNNINKIFFEINKSNQELVNIYNQKVSNYNEFSEFFFSTKQFCFLIINNFDENSFSGNIPKYLFRERGFLIDMFKKYNARKKDMLLKLLTDTEKNTRRNSSLSVVLGLRFLLNLKKITIS